MGILMYSDLNQIIKIIKVEQTFRDMYFGNSYILDYQQLDKGDILYCFETKNKYIVSGKFEDIENNLILFKIYNNDNGDVILSESRNNIYWDNITLKEGMTLKKIYHKIV